jgi:iron(III) transport system permease protein
MPAGRAWLRGIPGAAGRLGMPLFWLLLACFILLPCACFLLLAVSPRLFGQGSRWFTLTYLHQALTGATAVALANSLWVSGAAAGFGVAVGFPLAWLAARTALPGRALVGPGMWLVLLLPSWLPALGWQRLVQPDGVMDRIGLDWPWLTHTIMGPSGVVLLLGLRCVPFSYLAISAALAGLGQEFEDAARVHGASRTQALRLIVPILAPAIASALAIGFAESISDFGVAATLAYGSDFPLATYQLYAAIGNFPPSFPLAAAMGWLLVAAVAIPLALQARATGGRSYAVLSGRSRQAVRRRLGPRAAAGSCAGAALFFVVALGVPGFGAVSGSLLADYGGSFRLTLATSSLPTNARVLVGAVSQLQPSLKDAARAHGAGAVAAWARGVLPAVSRPIAMAWLYTFCGVFLELPLSQLLYAPGSPPASIAIEDNLSTYHFGVGMAQAVLATAVAFAAVGVVLGGYRLLAPAGWRRIGSAAAEAPGSQPLPMPAAAGGACGG